MTEMKPMKKMTEKPISESAAFRLANVTRQRGRQILGELGIEPLAVVGRVRLHPPSVIRQLLDAAARSTK
jgi:hypothetical protein